MFQFFEATTPQYALSLEVMVRPTVPDHVLHVRTADVWIGVVFTKSSNGVKRDGLLGLAQMRSAGCIGRGPLSGTTRKKFAHIEFFSA
jgi:hypothetical protein